jgi:hypothetical protein
MKLKAEIILDIDAPAYEEAVVLFEGRMKLIGAEIITVKKAEDQRTKKQNNALHLWFRLFAKDLNDAGYDMKKTLREEIDIPWSEYSVKEQLWRPIEEVVTGKRSTKALSKEDVSKIYDIIDREIGKRTGVHTDFPDIELLLG